MITVTQLNDDTCISHNPLSQETLSKSASKEQLQKRLANQRKTREKKPLSLKKRDQSKKSKKTSPVLCKPKQGSPALKVVPESRPGSNASSKGPIKANIASMKRKSMIYT